MGVEQAERVTFAVEVLFWGCAGLNFRATLPFNGMRQDFVASERDPHGPTIR
jgi:hypothetical protein